MSRTMQLHSRIESFDAPSGTFHVQRDVRNDPTIRTDAVYVVYTTIGETLSAVRVASDFAGAFGVPVTVIHFRAVPYELPVDAPTGLSPVETDPFLERLRTECPDAQVRVYLCRNAQQAIAEAFTPHSLIVIAGRHGWWLTRSERWRRVLEAAGHHVVFVDMSRSSAVATIWGEASPEEQPHAPVLSRGPS